MQISFIKSVSSNKPYQNLLEAHFMQPSSLSCADVASINW